MYLGIRIYSSLVNILYRMEIYLSLNNLNKKHDTNDKNIYATDLLYSNH